MPGQISVADCVAPFGFPAARGAPTAGRGDRREERVHVLADLTRHVRAQYLQLRNVLRGAGLRDSRIDTPHAQMTWCTVVPGNYHFQAKVADGQGEYRVGIYTR